MLNELSLLQNTDATLTKQIKRVIVHLTLFLFRHAYEMKYGQLCTKVDLEGLLAHLICFFFITIIGRTQIWRRVAAFVLMPIYSARDSQCKFCVFRAIKQLVLQTTNCVFFKNILYKIVEVYL